MARFFLWRSFVDRFRIAGLKFEQVWLSKMADSADNDLEEASIWFSAEYCGIREWIERMNRGKAASFVFALFLFLHCKLYLEKHKPCYETRHPEIHTWKNKLDLYFILCQ